MSSKQVKITFNPLGQPRIEADGFTGTSCQDATKAFEDLLNGGGKKETLKDEYYMSESEGQSIDNTGF